MRPLEQCRLADEFETVREVLIRGSLPGRRTGATMLVDAEGLLSGIFTDSDLARLFERRRDQDLDRPIREVMTKEPLRITSGAMMIDAVAIMARRKISELPIVDGIGKPIGLIDITDVVALLPKDAAASTMASVPPPATLRVVGALEVGRGA
jgi:arabinose-5-phosphate isomerase